MTSFAIAKLVCDALLFAGLVLLSSKLLRKPSNNGSNILKLKELESSIKEVVRQADDASRSLTEELRSRKHDLERILIEAQKVEGRLSQIGNSVNDQVRDADFASRNLEQLIQRANQEIQQRPRFENRNIEALAINQQVEVERFDSQQYEAPRYVEPAPRRSEQTSRFAEPLPRVAQTSRIERPATRKSPQFDETIPPPPTGSFQYEKMLEPPSFSQIAEVTEKKISPRNSLQAPLSQRIEKTIESVKDKQAKESLRAIAAAADKTLAATGLPKHLEQGIADVEQAPRHSLEADPRLGVLGGIKRTSQVV